MEDEDDFYSVVQDLDLEEDMRMYNEGITAVLTQFLPDVFI